MATHDKINEAVSNLQRCALQNPEQYQILNGCRSFIANGAKLFDDTNSVSYLIKAINAQQITYLNKKIIEIKTASSEQTAGDKIYKYVMDELYKFSFEKNDAIEMAPTAKTSAFTPRKPSQSAVNPSRQSNKSTYQLDTQHRPSNTPSQQPEDRRVSTQNTTAASYGHQSHNWHTIPGNTVVHEAEDHIVEVITPPRTVKNENIPTEDVDEIDQEEEPPQEEYTYDDDIMDWNNGRGYYGAERQ